MNFPPTHRQSSSSPASRAALTLVELTIVAAIAGILALIALPSFRDAMTRSQIAVTRNNQRLIAGALEVYRVDHQTLPPTRPHVPEDVFGILAHYQLGVLTTPVAYVQVEALVDPFGAVRPQSQSSAAMYRSPARGGVRPVPTLPNPKQSQLYFLYASLAAMTGNPYLLSNGAGLVSLGPDREDSFGAFYPFPEAFPPLAHQYGFEAVLDTLYDPTNGTYSRGDIPRYVSVAGVEVAP